MTLEGALLYPASLGLCDGRVMNAEFFCHIQMSLHFWER